MAITTNLPPQAYTRETLVKAIDWMTTQPASVRERANSADLVVSHYLQYRRSSAAAHHEAPVSGETFKSDLKHLAQDLKQFEDPSAPPHNLGRPHVHVPPVHVPPVTPHFVEEFAAPLPPPPAPPRHEEAAMRTRTVVSWNVDSRSVTIARELQARLNLSSEGEALRMLIALGAERLREILP